MTTSLLRTLVARTSLARARPNYLSGIAAASTDCPKIYDLVVVGGGIIGCATAREMKCRHPKLKIAIVEKEDEIALHQTGHNSGVIHAGIYYKPGSMKAKLCVEGMKLVYDYLCEKNIPHKKIGKLIIATDQDQVCRLTDLYERAIQNDCLGIELVDKECIGNFEPKAEGEKALWSPWTGIVDWACVCKHFAEDFKNLGGDVHLNFEVTGFAESVESKGPSELAPICVYSKNKYIHAKYVLTCGGLHSDRLAIMTGCGNSPRIVPFRGDYFLLNDEKKCMVTKNIYPVPDPKLPFLGVHFTPRVNGDVWLGPNAVLALSREGYTWRDINMRDCIEMIKFPGLYKLSFRYLVPGVKEIVKSIYYPLAIQECSKFVPNITHNDVRRGPSGVRAQAVDDDGYLVDDFVFDCGKGCIGERVIHCRNAPSPGATSSMAIAKFISDKLACDFKF